MPKTQKAVKAVRSGPAGAAKGRPNSGDPASKVRTISISTVTDMTRELAALRYTERPLWYRGIGNATYKLLPSLFRHRSRTGKKAMAELEGELNETFRMRSFPYTEAFKWADQTWDQLFFMQHYRVPTRLLDWSGSPLVSLHFALTSGEVLDNGKPKTDAAVWVLDPIAWNKAVFRDTGFEGGILSPRDTRLSRYSTQEVYQSPMNIPPVALRGAHNSARIVAQQGYFTIFGPESTPMEDIYLNQKSDSGDRIFPDHCLVKFVIPKGSISDLKSEMFSLGISETVIYPDLEGLAFELKRTFEF